MSTTADEARDRAEAAATATGGREAPQAWLPQARLAAGVPPEARAALERVIEHLEIERAEPSRVLLVTGAEEGDGVSTIVTWLLGLLAESRGGRLLRLDAGAAGARGNGRAGAVPQAAPSGRARFASLAVPPGPPGPALAELRRGFDWIVVDAPPPAISPATLALAREADGVVLVLEARRTDRESAQSAAEALRRAGGRLLAAILNKSRGG